MSIRVEQFDGGEVVYIALDPDGIWARSDFPDELVTVDYDAQGGVIGIEVIGSLAHRSANAIFAAITSAEELVNLEAVQAALSRAAARPALDGLQPSAGCWCAPISVVGGARESTS